MALLDPQRGRTPRDKCGLAFLPRCPVTKRVLAIDPFERFLAKCEFDSRTGCVVWTGGTTQGRGNSATYGSFWYEGKRWFAHRWAAVFIHGLDVDGLTVGHNCPHTPDGHPNTLCVQHLAGETLAANVAERNTRHAKARKVEQDATTRQFWLLVDRGYEPAPPVHDPASFDPNDIPFFEPPAWLKGKYQAPATDDCPF